ncbi:hypothetical protein HYY75_04480 [bacterium]|nr:hypothetical protein [bacterium]
MRLKLLNLRLNKKSGVTLLEIVIASAIIVIAFIPIMTLISTGSKSTAKSGNLSKATRLVQELIEECRHVSFKEYPLKSIDEFRDLNKKSLKDFLFSANLRFCKNDLKQIKEVWLEAEIQWRDIGRTDGENTANNELRVVRAGNGICNPFSK